MGLLALLVVVFAERALHEEDPFLLFGDAHCVLSLQVRGRLLGDWLGGFVNSSLKHLRVCLSLRSSHILVHHRALSNQGNLLLLLDNGFLRLPLLLDLHIPALNPRVCILDRWQLLHLVVILQLLHYLLPLLDVGLL